MVKQTGEQIVEASAEALTMSSEAAVKFMKGNVDAESGNASRATVALTDSSRLEST